MMIILLTDYLCLMSQISGTYKIVAKAEAESICALKRDLPFSDHNPATPAIKPLYPLASALF
jgi:hypothetical protein